MSAITWPVIGLGIERRATHVHLRKEGLRARYRVFRVTGRRALVSYLDHATVAGQKVNTGAVALATPFWMSAERLNINYGTEI